MDKTNTTALVLSASDNAAVRQGVCNVLEQAGITLLNEDGKAALDDADFLILVAESAEQTEGREVEPKWEYFADEVKWKRKAFGEIVIVDASAVSFSPSRLSYALKKCKRFRYDKLGELAAYLALRNREKAAAANAENPISIFPLSMKVSSGNVKSPRKRSESGACRDDHVFGEDTGTKRYLRDESGACRDDHVFGEDTGTKRYLRDESDGVCRDDHVFGEDTGTKRYLRDESGGVCRDDHVFGEDRQTSEATSACEGETWEDQILRADEKPRDGRENAGNASAVRQKEKAESGEFRLNIGRETNGNVNPFKSDDDFPFDSAGSSKNAAPQKKKFNPWFVVIAVFAGILIFMVQICSRGLFFGALSVESSFSVVPLSEAAVICILAVSGVLSL